MNIWENLIEDFEKALPSDVQCELKMINSTESLTRFANSHIHQNVEEEITDVYLTIHLNGKTKNMNFNITSIKSAKDIIEKALSGIENNPEDITWPGLADKNNSFNGLKEISPEDPDLRAKKVKEFIDQGKDFNAAGYCSSNVSNVFVWNSNGLNSADTATGAFLDGIFRSETSAGSSHIGNKNLNEIDASNVGKEAYQIARESQNPEDIDPGTYEVILGPDAVSTILVFLSVYGFNAKSKVDGTSPIEIDSNQFDTKLTLIDDPFAEGALNFKIDSSGSKKTKTNIILEGVPKSFFHTRRTSKELKDKNTFHEMFGWGDSFGGIGTNLYLKPGETKKDEMISNVKKGIYINEFWYCRVLDPITQVVTGLNRNGSYLIEDGKITKPVGRLRFTQSFMKSLSQDNVVSVGSENRFADSEFGEGILNVPMLHLKEFNFTGGVSG